jgi:membrane protein
MRQAPVMADAGDAEAGPESRSWGYNAVASLDRWQRRHTVGGFAVAVVKKFSEDRGSSHGALIAFYAFFSLFPLLLAFTSILGFVLEGDPTLRDDIVDTALAQIPVIGDQLRDEVHPLTGSGMALLVGLVGALWAGLGVTLSMGQAFAQIWDVPRVDLPNPVRARLRGLAVLVVLATTLVVSTAVAGLAAGGGIGPAGERAAALIVSLAGNSVVFLSAFALLTPRPREIRDLLPGVAFAAVGALILQTVGGWYVDRTITDAGATYGTFALVIGLLSWFWLGAQLLLLAAEMNVVRSRRLWPRSLTGELEPADRAVLERSAAAARADRRERIVVDFDEGAGPPIGPD